MAFFQTLDVGCHTPERHTPERFVFKNKKTRGPRTLAIFLTTVVRITLVNFAQMLLDINFEKIALNHPKKYHENYKVNATPYPLIPKLQ